ncbi:hypothetical protein VTN00DRAFT_8025 [Thermoascus crustaceus]|uniref:uncharacterized protein n=1 Tax=Thermoascus crustaceus TaxID=5088 RepID=UPI0037443B1E
MTRHPGILHKYSSKLVAFEYAASSNAKSKPHSLLFVGGLSDGLSTVRYVADLVEALEPTDWSVFSVVLTSSYVGWGLSSLGKDVEEIAQCVEYVRDYKASKHGGPGKVVIMGHSTGSQDVLHYLHAPNPLQQNPDFDDGLLHLARPEVDGAILQAPVSDREGLLALLKSGTPKDTPHALEGLYSQLVNMAKTQTYTDDKMDSLLPLDMTARMGYPPNVALSSRRFLSLASPDSPENPREDDLFSSDLTDKRLRDTFGMIVPRGLLKTKLLVLYSGKDEFAPEWVDKEKLLQRWKLAADGAGKHIWDSTYSGVVPGATHALSGDDENEARRDLASRVTGYLKSIE